MSDASDMTAARQLAVLALSLIHIWLLHELNEEGKTVIIVTHDQGIIEDEPYVVKI